MVFSVISGYIDVDNLYNTKRFRNLPDMRGGLSVSAKEILLEHGIRLPRRVVMFVDGKETVAHCFVRERTIRIDDHHQLGSIVA